MANCEWAPVSHDAEAIALAVLQRPCGHTPNQRSGYVPTCSEHLLWVMRQPDAGSETNCPICGENNRPTLKAAQPINGDGRQTDPRLGLLGPARMVLDRCAEGVADPGEAADMAQRIVDWIGHPVTDEPARAADLAEELRLQESPARALAVALGVDDTDPAQLMRAAAARLSTDAGGRYLDNLEASGSERLQAIVREVRAEKAEAALTEMVPLTLVPVEVFGAGLCDQHCEHCETHEGYGLCDAVSGWSDCNRAWGRIYRVEDAEGHREPGDTVQVWVWAEDRAWFEKRFGDDEGLSEDAAVKAAKHSHYVSTYCIHDNHGACRETCKTCKTCEKACRCGCHEGEQR